MAKPKCPVCSTIQPAKPGERVYRCPRCGTRFESAAKDGPASNDPIRSAEIAEAKEQNARRHTR